MKHGIVLTSAPDCEYVRRVLVAGSYRSLKVITAWGINGGPWRQSQRALILAHARHVVVRSRWGDGLGPDPFPNWEKVVEEFQPWYDAVIKGYTELTWEIGNEPDKRLDTDPAGYAWHLVRAISACRAIFPDVKIISPALSDRGFKKWMRSPEFVSAIELCDYIGVHRYAHNSLVNDDTGHGALHATIQSRKPFALTEMGINDANTPKKTKIARYINLVTRLPRKYELVYDYHLCTAPLNVDQHNYALGIHDFA